jgi:hypothetical protein
MSTWEPTPQEQASLVVFIKQHDLSRPNWFDSLPMDTIIANTNGIGGDSTPGILREALSEHLLPEFRAAAIIHDLRWTFGDGTVEDWHDSNRQFEANCIKSGYVGISAWRFLARYDKRQKARIAFEVVDLDSLFSSYRKSCLKHGPSELAQIIGG